MFDAVLQLDIRTYRRISILYHIFFNTSTEMLDLLVLESQLKIYYFAKGTVISEYYH